MSLLDIAKKKLVGRPVESTFSFDDVELYTAFLNGEVTERQVRDALGRSPYYCKSWQARIARQLYALGYLKIEYGGKTVVVNRDKYRSYEQQHIQEWKLQRTK
jgi:hypothetical protein